MAERRSDRWVSIVLSVLLHGALVAALVYGFWAYTRSRPPTPTLAIEATVVDPRSVSGAAQQPAPEPPPAPPPPAPPAPEPPPQPEAESTGPPEPSTEELAQREQAKKEQAEREAQEQRKAQEEKEAQERKAQEEKEAQERQRQAEEQRQKAEEKRKAEEAARKAEAKKRAEAQLREADEKSRAEREAELQRSLVAEEHSVAARSSGALASWQAQIAARIRRAWLQPPSARPGIECELHVKQVPGGEVVNVTIGACNGDQAVRESIEAAAYRASPLPPPPDPSLFERDLDITFKPN